jgi:hypothetical protein
MDLNWRLRFLYRGGKDYPAHSAPAPVHALLSFWPSGGRFRFTGSLYHCRGRIDVFLPIVKLTKIFEKKRS